MFNIILEFLCPKNLKEIIKVFQAKKKNSKGKLKDFLGLVFRHQDSVRASRPSMRFRPRKSLSFSSEFFFLTWKTLIISFKFFEHKNSKILLNYSIEFSASFSTWKTMICMQCGEVRLPLGTSAPEFIRDPPPPHPLAGPLAAMVWCRPVTLPKVSQGLASFLRTEDDWDWEYVRDWQEESRVF